MENFFTELKRRHIYRVAAAYAVVAWVVIQLVNNVTPMLNLPNAVGTTVLVLLAAGFPIALIFASVAQLSSSQGDMSATGKLDWFIAAALIAVLAAVSYQQFTQTPAATTAQQANVTAATPAPQPQGFSIAVLPFANLSGDASQEFFS